MLESEEDLLLSVRSGDEEEVDRLLADGVVDARDERGNSSLHYAAANGYSSILSKLLKASNFSVRTLKNHEGNTPLHWALSNKHFECVRILLDYDVDILEKNNIGRSPLNVVFDMNPPEDDMLALLLNHSSAAALEQPLQPMSKLDTQSSIVSPSNESGTSTRADSHCGENFGNRVDILGEVTHMLKFESSKKRQADCSFEKRTDQEEENSNPIMDDDTNSGVVLCREISVSSPNQKPTLRLVEDRIDTDVTGSHCWSASVIAAQWYISLSNQGAMKGKRVIELGAGCGLGGLALAALSLPSECPSEIYLTDLPTFVLDNLIFNCRLNGSALVSDASSHPLIAEHAEALHPTKVGNTAVHVCELDWNRIPEGVKADVLLGSDLVYDENMAETLFSAVEKVLEKPGGRFYYVYNKERREAREFVDLMVQKDMKVFEVTPPASFRDNPFVYKTKEECGLIFNELEEGEFVMVNCGWR